MGKQVDKRITEWLNKTDKAILRQVVDKVITIEESKLNKLNRNKCIKRINHLSYSQLTILSK